MAITATQKWYAGAAVASVAVVTAGWFLLVSPQQTTASEINAQTAQVQQSNLAAEAQIATLKAQYKDLPALQSQVAAIRVRLPQDPNEPTLIRTLAAAAKKTGVVLGSVQVQPPQAATAAGATAAGTDAFSAPGQVSQLPMSIQVTGSFAETRLFLNAIEGMQRSMLVTGLDITRADAAAAGSAASTGTVLTTSLTARVFMANPGAATTVDTSTTTPAGSTGTAPASAAS